MEQPNVPAPANGRPARRRWLRRIVLGLGIVVAIVLVVAAIVATWARLQLGRSLAQLDGEAALPGLGADVVVRRDAIGVPEIAGTSRVDVARALGFVHAQERFFQMDLARRRAAGELAELVGAAALPLDRASRLHRFRARAARVLAAATPQDRELLEAYAAGVNTGLTALERAPFEYLVLRADPRPWRPEDSVLVVASMFFNLQDDDATMEGRTTLMHEVFPRPLADFLRSGASSWDTPIEGDALPVAAIPGPEVFDLRRDALPRAAERRMPPTSPLGQRSDTPWLAGLVHDTPGEELVTGSNNWAVAGARTADGRAILANDMHLGLSVPNTWFRASLTWATPDGRHRVTGVTLPGVPSVTVGSNGHVAWGFTNTTADWSDRVLIEPVGDGSDYRTPFGTQRFSIHRERLRVAGGEDQWMAVRESIWGPVQADGRGRLHAIAWVPHHVEGLNLRLIALEHVRTIDEAFTAANVSGIPAQNLVVADANGNIGWTIAGRIPRRIGFDGRLAASWTGGARRWEGWYGPEEYPRVVNPPSGVIVTANNRVASGRGLEMLGDGGYDPGARARQIRDGLLALERPRARDMLRVQLDDRALLMDRWRSVALRVLTPATVAASPARREFRRLILDGWTGRASVDSVGYRLVRQFRIKVGELALAPFVARLRSIDPTFPAGAGRALEGPVWTLITVQPWHLLDPKYSKWDVLLLDAIDASGAELTGNDRRLDERTWGEANRAMVRHPLSPGLPWLARWLDMPRQPLPGDAHMPRVQTPAFGASERFAVSPGHEAEGYFHMPAGQSGHPLSPHYSDAHGAWVRGEPTPFLPGPPVATLVLRSTRAP